MRDEAVHFNISINKTKPRKFLLTFLVTLQLYEIDDNPKRKEFLDELFAFMQKRGTPINRLPIMAKQVLDLYELYNLVVARGGLVEVINKKQWQEIIKGLGLPSSITSAAFTLRTQYTKYLYPYESHTKGLSNPDDLQNAIDGNRREGRRMEPGYPMSGCQMSPMGGLPHLPPTSLSNLHSPPRGGGGPMSPNQQQEQLQALEMTRLALWKLYNQGQQPGLPPLMPNLPLDLFGVNQEKALNLHIAQEKEQQEKLNEQRKEEEKEEQRRREKQLHDRLAADQMREKERELKERLAELDRDQQSSPPPAKRAREEAGPVSPTKSMSSLPRNSTNIAMSTRQDEDGRTSMEISLEINGITYSGVLSAQPR